MQKIDWKGMRKGMLQTLESRTPEDFDKMEIESKRMDRLIDETNKGLHKEYVVEMGFKYSEFLKADLSLFSWFDYNHGSNYCFFGSVGNGKTLLATAITKEYLKEFKSIKLVEDSDFKSLALRITKGEEFISVFMTPKLLILEDVGTTAYTASTTEIFNTVLRDRIKKELPIVITTNSSLKAVLTDKNKERMRTDFTNVKFKEDTKR